MSSQPGLSACRSAPRRSTVYRLNATPDAAAVVSSTAVDSVPVAGARGEFVSMTCWPAQAPDSINTAKLASSDADRTLLANAEQTSDETVPTPVVVRCS